MGIVKSDYERQPTPLKVETYAPTVAQLEIYTSYVHTRERLVQVRTE